MDRWNLQKIICLCVPKTYRIYRKLEGPNTKTYFLREEKLETLQQYSFCAAQKMTGDLVDVFTFN